MSGYWHDFNNINNEGFVKGDDTKVLQDGGQLFLGDDEMQVRH